MNTVDKFINRCEEIKLKLGPDSMYEKDFRDLAIELLRIEALEEQAEAIRSLSR